MLQEASWKQTFRSDFLKSKLLLMLDDRDVLQEKLIRAIEEYAKHADTQNLQENRGDEKKLFKVAADIGYLLREKNKSLILNAGRRVLAAKREAIRRSI